MIMELMLLFFTTERCLVKSGSKNFIGSRTAVVRKRSLFGIHEPWCSYQITSQFTTSWACGMENFVDKQILRKSCACVRGIVQK